MPSHARVGPPVSRRTKSLSAIHKVCLVAGLVLIVGFGAITLLRSAYLTSRHTDAGVYFRAAWAVTANTDIYSATDNNGWHYHYPPLLAFALTPFADPPPGEKGGLPHLPYGLSIAIWYILNLFAIAWGVHVVASALERISSETHVRAPTPYGQAWWALRVFPVLACVEPIGHSLGRGQVNPLVLACICAASASFLFRRSTQGGAWLGLATAIKLFPAYLFLYPLWRFRWRALMTGLMVFVFALAVLPAMVLGPSQSITMVRSFIDVVVFQMIGGGESIRTRELFDLVGGDLMAFRSLFTKALWGLGVENPQSFIQSVTIAHVIVALTLTGITLASLRPWGARGHTDPLEPLFAIGLLVTAAVPMIPTAQSHYYMFSVILVMALLANDWEHHDNVLPSKRLSAVLISFAGLSAIREFPGFHAATHIGAPVVAGLILWVAGLKAVRQRKSVRQNKSPATVGVPGL